VYDCVLPPGDKPIVVNKYNNNNNKIYEPLKETGE
jgi:hypothetical protein